MPPYCGGSTLRSCQSLQWCTYILKCVLTEVGILDLEIAWRICRCLALEFRNKSGRGPTKLILLSGTDGFSQGALPEQQLEQTGHCLRMNWITISIKQNQLFQLLQFLSRYCRNVNIWWHGCLSSYIAKIPRELNGSPCLRAWKPNWGVVLKMKCFLPLVCSLVGCNMFEQ